MIIDEKKYSVTIRDIPDYASYFLKIHTSNKKSCLCKRQNSRKSKICTK